MSPSPSSTHTAKDILETLESLGDDKRRTFNAKVGNDGIAGVPLDQQFGCKTGDIRALAKKIKTDHALAQQLWKTGNMDAQLLALLIMKPKALSADELDTMVRETRSTWVTGWLQSYIIKKQPDAVKHELRQKWMKPDEPDSWVARAGWHLTDSMVSKGDDGVDVDAMLDRIEAEMPTAAPETKWTMNGALVAIGVKHAQRRARVIAIAERIGLYADWPVSKGCTIPYAPVWIDAMVQKDG